MIMGGARATYRAWKDQHRSAEEGRRSKRVVVLGAGRACAMLLREVAQSSEWVVVGLLDDDKDKHRLEIHGHKVLGNLAEIETLARRLKASHAIVAMPEATASERQRAARLCLRAGLTAMTLPALTQVIDDTVHLSHVREIDLEDLLGREPIRIDSKEVGHLLRGVTVMVTGAGGSIGSELCRQIAKFSPRELVFFEQNEFALYRLQEEFAALFPEIRTRPLIGDVKDLLRVHQVLRDARPAIIFHAAAYKHVPLMEEGNAWQAVINNVLGTHTVATAAIEHAVPHFVLVSTDKAVNPTNVMGATKRLAEMVCQSLQAVSTRTAFVTVRFGNVLGSAGSVIPKFQQQVAAGGPVTVTHPEVTRFFMSIPEAAQLVLQAAAIGTGGQIFVLEMGDPISITELARNIIRLSGQSEREVKIEFTGLRPGEKLHEELLASGEHTEPTRYKQLRIAKARGIAPNWLAGFLDALGTGCRDDMATRSFLCTWIEEYLPGAPTPSAVESSAKNDPARTQISPGLANSLASRPQSVG
jgi:FlaA1/EpsC-like NDP-sugar epimerase